MTSQKRSRLSDSGSSDDELVRTKNKRTKRSEIKLDEIPLPHTAIEEIQYRFHALTENEDVKYRVLKRSYHISNPNEMDVATSILNDFGFVKLKQTPQIDASILNDFYNLIKTTYNVGYEVDISNLESIFNHGREGTLPSSFNVGKIGPLTLLSSFNALNTPDISLKNCSFTLDPINQSVEAYAIKAYYAYDIFVHLLGGNYNLISSVEPTLITFPSKLVPTTRTVYPPGILSKTNNNTNQKSQYRALVAITNGDSLSLIPGSHRHFDSLLEYMEKSRYTDKRTVYASTPPELFNFDSYLVPIPIYSGEVLVYDKRIPTRAREMTEEFLKERKNVFETCDKIEPFIGINVSFFSVDTLTKSDLAQRSLSFCKQTLGSDLRIYGHIENVKRRNIPTILNPTPSLFSNLYNRFVSTGDLLIRRIIGLEEWNS